MTRGAPHIDVWVCARPRARHLGDVLAAIAAAGAAPRLAIAELGRGFSGPRNEALAACEGEVLALVDDDVEVSAGWFDALKRAWSGPCAEQLGCVGGPLGAHFTGERPTWSTTTTSTSS